MKSIAIISGSLTLLSCVDAISLKTVLTNNPKLSTLYGLLNQFDLLDQFDSFKNVTVIAPTNQAYLDLANWGFNVSEVPAPVARSLLSYHILQGEHTYDSLDSHPDVIHSYLKPPILTNVTDGAAVKLSRVSRKILTQSGLGVYGGVEEEDLHFDDGVLHTLNASMVLPHNITLTAQINGLTGFLDLMSKADLVGEFEALQDVTILVPSNEALERLAWLLELLPKSRLAKVLKAHIVPKQVLYGKVVKDGDVFETLEGGKVKFGKAGNGNLHVNGVDVINSDVIMYGGVAHVVGDVVAPSGEVEGMYPGKSTFAESGHQVPMV